MQRSIRGFFANKRSVTEGATSSSSQNPRRNDEGEPPAKKSSKELSPSIDAVTIEPSSNSSVSEAKSVGEEDSQKRSGSADYLNNADLSILLKNNSSTQSLTDKEKYTLLTHHFKPGGRYVFPKTKLHNKMRSFQRSWQTAYPWLVYSESEDGGFCKYCMLFATYNAAGVLVSSALTNFNKATDILKEHHRKEYHIAASVKAENFIKIMQKPQKAISSIIDTQRSTLIEKNRKLLHSIISCIVFCGRQNIALRGHVESTDGENNAGNFLALLKFRADAGDEVLANHFSQATNRAKYTSPTIQNELISILGEQVRESIVNQIPFDAPYFSILADEVTDVSNREQLSLVIRFVDSDGNIHEEFLGFQNLQRITGEAIASSILDTLPQWNLDIKNCRGQGYDGASNMSSSRRGTQALIREKSPKAVYTHCRAHCLNLTIVHSCDQPLIRNMLGTFNEVCNFFKYSPKRNKFLLVVIEKETPEASKTTLLSLCRTRWVERHEAHEVFFALLPSILKALEAMSNERLFADQFGETTWNWETDSKSKANNLLHAVSNFEFIITQITTMKCLSILKPLSIKLQKRDIDVYEAYNHIKDLKGELQDIRGDIDKYCSDWYDTYVDPNNDAVMSSLLCLLPALLFSREGNPVQAAFQYYADDLPSPQVFDVELFRWRRKWLNADQDHLPSSAAQALEECNHEFFPNVHKLLRILCTLPITSAECERSFSTLRRLKTYLRATMTSERESGLALMNIHYGRQIDISTTIDLFARKHPRRLLLSDILAE
ncbi:zinc finger MYM-type protein 1-like [Acropora millepora]|uniref:zinc finger MYM-type protein 1-like n=1 Tax=Acropora millepora TaxID=45264 RepID=UPI001CF555AE|nr:zinc finger MYM-type protein 1-like [Acropora millepora]